LLALVAQTSLQEVEDAGCGIQNLDLQFCFFRTVDDCRVAVQDVGSQITKILKHVLVFFESCSV
jgi:hypothetical protein